VRAWCDSRVDNLFFYRYVFRIDTNATIIVTMGQQRSPTMERVAVKIDEKRLERVRAKLVANSAASPSGCVLWNGYTQPNGYGWINVAGLKIAAHRAALILSGVDVPAGSDVCHRCDVRNCVNPDHLYVGSRRQNMADCTARRRHNKPRGASHWCAKLSDEHVRQIRARVSSGERQTAVAASLNVNSGTVSRIARGVWRGEIA
jgi:hypothetical protein